MEELRAVGSGEEESGGRGGAVCRPGEGWDLSVHNLEYFGGRGRGGHIPSSPNQYREVTRR